MVVRGDIRGGMHPATICPGERHPGAGAFDTSLIVRKTAPNLVGARWEPLLCKRKVGTTL